MFGLRLLVIASGLLAVLPLPSRAQTPDWCSLEGSRIRIRSTQGVQYQGMSLGCSGGSLVIETDGNLNRSAPFIYRSVAVLEVERVEVSRGMRVRWIRAAVIGSAIGGALFGGSAYLTGHDGAPCIDGLCIRVSRGEKLRFWGSAGLLLGMAGGLVVAFTNPNEDWKPWPEVPLVSDARLTVAPHLTPEAAFGIRMTIMFGGLGAQPEARR